MCMLSLEVKTSGSDGVLCYCRAVKPHLLSLSHPLTLPLPNLVGWVFVSKHIGWLVGFRTGATLVPFSCKWHSFLLYMYRFMDLVTFKWKVVFTRIIPQMLHMRTEGFRNGNTTQESIRRWWPLRKWGSHGYPVPLPMSNRLCNLHCH
jgi:hypothetical protein